MQQRLFDAKQLIDDNERDKAASALESILSELDEVAGSFDDIDDKLNHFSLTSSSLALLRLAKIEDFQKYFDDTLIYLQSFIKKFDPLQALGSLTLLNNVGGTASVRSEIDEFAKLQQHEMEILQAIMLQFKRTDFAEAPL
jgi:hypothetical protein